MTKKAKTIKTPKNLTQEQKKAIIKTMRTRIDRAIYALNKRQYTSSNEGKVHPWFNEEYILPALKQLKKSELIDIVKKLSNHCGIATNAATIGSAYPIYNAALEETKKHNKKILDEETAFKATLKGKANSLRDLLEDLTLKIQLSDLECDTPVAQLLKDINAQIAEATKGIEVG